jgi:hypothetical protein
MKRELVLDKLVYGSLHFSISMQFKPPLDEFYWSPSRHSKKMALLMSQHDADVSFQLGDNTVFKVHFQVIWANAPKLVEFCKDEAENSIVNNPITIENISSGAFMLFLEHVYAANLTNNEDMIKFGQDIIRVADKFKVVELKIAVENALVGSVLLDLENVCDYILFADAFHYPLLKEHATDYYSVHLPDISMLGYLRKLALSPELVEEIMTTMSMRLRGAFDLWDGDKSVTELRMELAKAGKDVDGSRADLIK